MNELLQQVPHTMKGALQRERAIKEYTEEFIRANHQFPTRFEQAPGYGGVSDTPWLVNDLMDSSLKTPSRVKPLPLQIDPLIIENSGNSPIPRELYNHYMNRMFSNTNPLIAELMTTKELSYQMPSSLPIELSNFIKQQSGLMTQAGLLQQQLQSGLTTAQKELNNQAGGVILQEAVERSIQSRPLPPPAPVSPTIEVLQGVRPGTIINPSTGREIKQGGQTHKNLIAQGQLPRSSLTAFQQELQRATRRSAQRRGVEIGDEIEALETAPPPTPDEIFEARMQGNSTV